MIIFEQINFNSFIINIFYNKLIIISWLYIIYTVSITIGQWWFKCKCVFFVLTEMIFIIYVQNQIWHHKSHQTKISWLSQTFGTIHEKLLKLYQHRLQLSFDRDNLEVQRIFKLSISFKVEEKRYPVEIHRLYIVYYMLKVLQVLLVLLICFIIL